MTAEPFATFLKITSSTSMHSAGFRLPFKKLDGSFDTCHEVINMEDVGEESIVVRVLNTRLEIVHLGQGCFRALRAFQPTDAFVRRMSDLASTARS